VIFWRIQYRVITSEPCLVSVLEEEEHVGLVLNSQIRSVGACEAFLVELEDTKLFITLIRYFKRL